MPLFWSKCKILISFTVQDSVKQLVLFVDSITVAFNNKYCCLYRDGLMSYKQFIQELEDDILPSEAERRYAYICGVVLVLKQG